MYAEQSVHAQAVAVGKARGREESSRKVGIYLSINQMIGGGGAGIAVALILFGSGGGGSDVVLVPNNRLLWLGFLLPGTLRRLTVAKPAAAAGSPLASPAAAASASNALVSRARPSIGTKKNYSG
jgi:hypothetical protein